MAYAERTKVSVSQTRLEIEKLLTKAGASSFANAWEDQRAMLQFRLRGRIIRFTLPLPKTPDTAASTHAYEKILRQKWRGLLLTIKAKIESVDSGIELFEVAFMAQIVMPGNVTVEQMAMPAIREAYKSGKAPTMLLDWNK